MALLSRPLRLHDVADVEALMARAIERSGHTGTLRPHQRDDLLTYLVEVAWELSLRWEPDRGGPNFGVFAYVTGQRRIIDWFRAEFGRSRWQWAGHSYERERPDLVLLDDGLVDALPAGTGDPALDSSPDLRGLLDAGDRQEARDYLALGLDPPRRAA